MAVSEEEARRRAALAAIAAEREAAESEPVVEESPPREPGGGGGSQRRGLLIGLVVGGLVVVVVAILLLAGGGGDDDDVATEDTVAAAGSSGAGGSEGAGADDATGTTAPVMDDEAMADMDDRQPAALPDPLPGPPLDLTVADAEVLAPQVLGYRRWLMANPDLSLIPAIAMADTPAEGRLEFELNAELNANERVELDDYHFDIHEIHRMGQGIGFHLHESYSARRVLDADTGELKRTEPGAREINSHIMLWPQPDGQWLLGIFEPGTMAEGMNHEEWLRELGQDPSDMEGMDDMEGMEGMNGG